MLPASPFLQLPTPKFIRSGTVDLAVYRWGEADTPPARPTLVLVHGYPDAADVWCAVAEKLADRFDVVAYDVRGAGRSSAPKTTADYAFPQIVGDLRAVIDEVSPTRPVHLVAFDWGSLQAWEALLCGCLDGRVASYSTAAPALDHASFWFLRRLQRPTLRGLLQAFKRMLGSSYMAFFQLPLIPELGWRFGMARYWPRYLFKLEGIRVAPRETQMADGQNGVRLYRANVPAKLRNPLKRTTNVPVQLLIMQRDPFVTPTLFEDLEQWAPRLVRREFDCGHWGVLSHPRPIADAIAQFVLANELARVSSPVTAQRASG